MLSPSVEGTPHPPLLVIFRAVMQLWGLKIISQLIPPIVTALFLGVGT